MGFWNKLGKIALVAAPYVAAPFTGGTSLMLTGAANAAEQRWAQHDAEKAIAEGREPSHFDRWLGLGANVAGIASGVGAMGSIGGAAGSIAGAATTAGKIAGAANAASGALGAVEQGKNIHAANAADGNVNVNNKLSKGLGPSAGVISGSNPPPASSPSSKYTSGIGPSPIMPMGGYSYNDNPMNQFNQNNPNLAQSIFQGRQEAIRNQPFRAGYDVNTFGGTDNNTPTTQRMPQIYDSNQGYNPPSEAATTTPENTKTQNDAPKKSMVSNSKLGRGMGRAGLRA